jgi:hypothetical protein
VPITAVQANMALEPTAFNVVPLVDTMARGGSAPSR